MKHVREGSDPIEPDLGPLDGVADELLIHGLLGPEPADRTSERVAAVMAAIAADERTPRRRWWPLLTLGAVAALVLAAIWLATSSSPAAVDLWTEALHAAARAGDRRYEVRAAWSEGDVGMDVTGELDVRDAGNYVFRANVGEGRVAIGALAGERWLAGDDALVRHLRAHPRGRGPFAMEPHGSVFGSLDALLAAVPADYDVRQSTDAAAGLVHLVAERRRAGTTPVRVDVWVEPGSLWMRRVSLLWRNEHSGAAPRVAGDLTGHHHMHMTLMPTRSFAADWFRPERHR